VCVAPSAVCHSLHLALGVALLLSAMPRMQRWRLWLIRSVSSTMCDQQMTAKAMSNLRAHGLTIPNILATPEAELDRLIRCVGFHTKKAKYAALGPRRGAGCPTG